METYEFSNIGVDRRYEELQPSDASINTQFDTMELEDEVSLKYKQLFTQNDIANPSLCAVTAILTDTKNENLISKLKILLDSGASSSITLTPTLTDLCIFFSHLDTNYQTLYYFRMVLEKLITHIT